MRTKPILILAFAVGCASCLEAVKGPGAVPTAAPPASLVAASTLACEDHGPTPHKWTSNFDAKRVEHCVYHQRDDLLDVKLVDGEVDVYEVLIHEFKGSGSYVTGTGAKSSHVAVIARGGSEGATVTRVGTDHEACTASCTIEVPDAKVTTVDPGGKGSVTVELSCPTLAGPGPGCITCKVGTPAAKLTIPDCSRAD